MFGLGANELILILLFGFIIFGPDKMPAMAKTIGQAIKKFRSAQDEMTNVIKNEVYDPDADDPFKNPLDAISKLEESAKSEDKAESFSDRKARYDRQREAKKAAEEKRAARAKKTAEAEAKDADAETKLAQTEAKDSTADDTSAKKPTADDLYGTKPRTKTPKAKGGSAPVKAKSASAEPVDKAVSEATDETTEEGEE